MMASSRILTKKLNDMLLARRVFGTISREEFVAVSMMSWFHLTLESNNSIVKDLRAEAESEEQRLYKIAQQVWRARARSFGQLLRDSGRPVEDSSPH
jgi:hypothetical protein